MHFPFGYDPDPPGGTEIYVRGLAIELQQMGVSNVICAPGREAAHYQRDGLPVWRFTTKVACTDLRDLYGEGDDGAAEQAGRILEAEQPDIVHLHAFTSGVSLKVLRQAKRCGCRVVFTYHTPTVSCLSGTLLRDGQGSCDGRMLTWRCTRCMAGNRGAAPVLAWLLGCLPPMAGRALGFLRLRGRIGTALRCSELVALRHRTVRCLFREADHLVAVCGWAARILEENGVPREKVTICRHGVSAVQRIEATHTRNDRNSALRVVFLGRLHPTKGPHDLVAAFRGAPQLKASLDIYGVAQDSVAEEYAREIRDLANGDPRISFCGQLPPAQVIETLADYDVLAVPSQTFETGPMVILEAFAAGTPVIGWDVGGVNELIEHGVNGLLIELPSLGGWISAFQSLASNRPLLNRLRQGVRPPRTMQQVALEMLLLYRALV